MPACIYYTNQLGHPVGREYGDDGQDARGGKGGRPILLGLGCSRLVHAVALGLLHVGGVVAGVLLVGRVRDTRFVLFVATGGVATQHGAGGGGVSVVTH